MGGKKKGNFFKNAADTAANVATKAVTFGAVGTDGSGYAQKLANGEGINLVDSAVGGTGIGGAVLDQAGKELMPGMPELPELENPLDQANRAADEVAKKFDNTYGGGKSGVASTMLGGSVSTDSSVLKKKKLLGE